jgi:nucleolar protein 56
MVRGRWLDRRAFLRSACAAGALSTAGCSARVEPSVSVPDVALVDEPVDVVVRGLGPYASVVVRASARSARTAPRPEWVAHARFRVADARSLSVADRAPEAGSYRGVDPTGLFWSKRPAGVPEGRRLPPRALFVPDETAYDVALTVEADGEAVAESTTTRRLFDPDVEACPVGRDGLVGTLFAPPGDDPAPAVLHLHGAGGAPHRATGRLLASHGFATLTLQYFGDPEPVPDTLVEVPVEYVETAVEWLRGRERVAGPGVGLLGFSRGAELALLVGSRSDVVGAVVGWVPSGVVWEGLGHGRTPAGTSAWSVGGEPVPYLELAEVDPGPPPTPGRPYFEPALAAATGDELAAATIPVEATGAPVLLVSVTDDRRWPSAALSERVVDRLDATDYPYRYAHDSHPGAGHFVRFPYLPTAGTARDARNVYGGSQEANARANAAAWARTLSFLGDALRARPGPSPG